ncbi:MAG TPA: ShlB/FhaC/HecB family hemolysin secretion/activation protein [Gammaproteobacteria bacterium]|nr:ShlB/FhaC/HecB family hemolysin secretion/activation protein [Gammaproteobacteria bacterium]
MRTWLGILVPVAAAMSGSVRADGESAIRPQGVLPDTVIPREVPRDEPVFQIPPVFERPLGVEEGERVFVKGFVLKGVVDDTAAGIQSEEILERVERRFEELQALLEKLRIERQNQANVDERGFTPEEREAILQFMRSVVGTLDPDRQIEAYERFVDQLRLQRLERDQGLTIGQLQLIADEVTRYYRERGYFLARAVIPAQEVIDGIVTIQVLEGRLGTVVAEGNRRYPYETLAAPFSDVQGKLVTVERMEEALLTLQSYPGLLAGGVLRPGERIGTADIVLNVQREKPVDVLVRADNHGTQFTGERRLVADFSWNNPLGHADIFTATVLQTFDPDNALYGGLRYEHPVAKPAYRLGFEVSRNTFDVTIVAPDGEANTDTGGISTLSRVYLDRQFMRTRQNKLKGTIDLNRKRADTEDLTSATGELLSRDDIFSLGLQLSFEHLDSETNSISSGFLRIDHGVDGVMGVPSADELLQLDQQGQPVPSRRFGNEAIASSDFRKLSVGYSRLQSITPSQTVLLRLNGQYSPDQLMSVEQFTIGGAANLRAIPTASFLTDNGVYGAIEWNIRAPGFADKPAFGGRTWGQVLGVTLFNEHAIGLFNLFEGELLARNTTGYPPGERISVGGYGMGLQIQLPWWSTALNVQYSRLKGGPRFPDDPTNPRHLPDGSQVWVDLTMAF